MTKFEVITSIGSVTIICTASCYHSFMEQREKAIREILKEYDIKLKEYHVNYPSELYNLASEICHTSPPSLPAIIYPKSQNFDFSKRLDGQYGYLISIP